MQMRLSPTISSVLTIVPLDARSVAQQPIDRVPRLYNRLAIDTSYTNTPCAAYMRPSDTKGKRTVMQVLQRTGYNMMCLELFLGSLETRITSFYVSHMNIDAWNSSDRS
jgi:hypothetical protein